MSEDIEALYPDSGLVIDSNKGGLGESEEVEDGVDGGGWDSHFSGAPLPNILAKFQVTARVLPLAGDPFGNIKSWWTWYAYCPGQSYHKVWGEFTVPVLSPGCLSISAIISKVALLLHSGKYWFICNFLSSSLCQTNNKPLALHSVLCGVSNALAIICESLIQINFLKISNTQVDSDGGAYCSDLLLMWILQLHVQHMQIMMLCHDIILYSMVSMPESYF